MVAQTREWLSQAIGNLIVTACMAKVMDNVLVILNLLYFDLVVSIS